MKRTKNQYLIFVLLICGVLLSTSCEKYLNEPSDKSLAIITSLEDLQALLDHSSMAIGTTSHMVSADNYYLTDEVWESLSEYDQRMYIWADNNVFHPATNSNDWLTIYSNQYRANTVLEYLGNIDRRPDNDEQWRDLKGQALVFRAMETLDAVQIWALAYDKATAQFDQGVPLRLNTDFNEPTTRANLQHTYEQIISDLKEAIPLLPVNPIAKVRPSKPSAYGLLARTYLWMREYESAQLYADTCLMHVNELLDYNELNEAINYPMPRQNVEVLLERGAATMILFPFVARIPEQLYDSYEEGDLRRSLFFQQEQDGLVSYRGSYYGGSTLHTGVTVDEMYLIRAECLARGNKIDEAMGDLNRLLSKRWRKNEYIFRSSSTADEALDLILNERRKQLLFRGLRWMDIKRLNKEGFNIPLERSLNSRTYRLEPNSPRFALPLPDDLLNYF